MLKSQASPTWYNTENHWLFQEGVESIKMLRAGICPVIEFITFAGNINYGPKSHTNSPRSWKVYQWLMAETESDNTWINHPNRNFPRSRLAKWRSWRRQNATYGIEANYAAVKAIVSISKRQLTIPEKLVLNKGLNFATIIKRIPYLDLIALIEDTALENP